jgi:hypothetical protein
MACHFLPSAFFQVWGNPMGRALLVAAPHSRLSCNKWLIFLATPYQSLVALFGPFVPAFLFQEST